MGTFPRDHGGRGGTHLDSLLHQVGQADLVLFTLRAFLVLILVIFVSNGTGLVLVFCKNSCSLVSGGRCD